MRSPSEETRRVLPISRPPTPPPSSKPPPPPPPTPTTPPPPPTLRRFNNRCADVVRRRVGLLMGRVGVKNTLVTAGSYSYMSTADTIPGTFHLISGAPLVDGYAVGPSDVAYHYDGSAPSTLVAS